MDGFHEESYDAFLKSELERLFESLVQQHQAVVEKVRASESPATAPTPLGPASPQSHSRLGSALRKQSKESEISTVNGAHSSVTSFPNSEASGSGGPIHNWGLLTRNLIARHHEEFEESESEDDQQMSYAKDILSLRPAWKGVLQQHALKREKTKTFNMSPHHKLHRMQDAETDEGCLQAFVRPPSSKIQILWSLIGSLLIVWDLITIPLELFDVQSLINFLVNVGRFSFAFWVLDVPLHAIFGVEIDGHLELRPRVLMRRYVRSWLPIDILVLSIDAALIVLQEIQNAQPEGSPVRSARYLRTLRLLRLLRLLRVAKLQQELTLLANNFLSTYAFMVMKVASGLLMILAVNHIIACCWYGLGRWTLDNGQSWLINAGIEEADMADAYAVSIHWALTQFTPATNNVAPVTVAERFFAVLVILLAMGTFSSFISSITTTVSTLRTAREEQFKNHSFLVRFFNERNLSTELYGKVNDMLKKQGAYDIRVKEADVELLVGVPERLKVYLHEEMYLDRLMTLSIWRYWKHDDDELFFRQVCHLAMVEHIATPGQDAFMPGTECTQVYIIENGSMGYIARQLTSFESEHVFGGEVFCLPCIWAEWNHRGRLTANTGKICYYNGVDAVTFANLVKKHGSPLWQYLQIFGILLIGEVEHMDGEDIWVTDKCLSDSKMDDVAARAQRFADIVNARHAHKGSFMATLGAIAHTSNSRSGSKSATDVAWPMEL
ncbi:unnamed protein product [Symbiodinium sp. CCMP2456]|nr:unnamed protein product [Symbiodinium sp. CCMP2456]